MVTVPPPHGQQGKGASSALGPRAEGPEPTSPGAGGEWGDFPALSTGQPSSQGTAPLGGGSWGSVAAQGIASIFLSIIILQLHEPEQELGVCPGGVYPGGS